MEDKSLIAPIENPQTLREVGIHLGNFSKSLDEIKITEQKHHAENIARNEEILKSLNSLRETSPSRKEFDSQKEDFQKSLDLKADKWVERTLVFVGSAFGLAIIAAIISLIFIHQ